MTFIDGTIGLLLLAILRRCWVRFLKEGFTESFTVNAYLFGVVSQQFYSYWCGGKFRC
jgi:hypothetical protein